MTRGSGERGSRWSWREGTGRAVDASGGWALQQDAVGRLVAELAEVVDIAAAARSCWDRRPGCRSDHTGAAQGGAEEEEMVAEHNMSQGDKCCGRRRPPHFTWGCQV